MTSRSPGACTQNGVLGLERAMPTIYIGKRNASTDFSVFLRNPMSSRRD